MYLHRLMVMCRSMHLCRLCSQLTAVGDSLSPGSHVAEWCEWFWRESTGSARDLKGRTVYLTIFPCLISLGSLCEEDCMPWSLEKQLAFPRNSSAVVLFWLGSHLQMMPRSCNVANSRMTREGSSTAAATVLKAARGPLVDDCSRKSCEEKPKVSPLWFVIDARLNNSNCSFHSGFPFWVVACTLMLLQQGRL